MKSGFTAEFIERQIRKTILLKHYNKLKIRTSMKILFKVEKILDIMSFCGFSDKFTAIIFETSNLFLKNQFKSTVLVLYYIAAYALSKNECNLRLNLK